MEASGLPHAIAYLHLKKEFQVYEWAPDCLDVLEKRKISHLQQFKPWIV